MLADSDKVFFLSEKIFCMLNISRSKRLGVKLIVHIHVEFLKGYQNIYIFILFN